VTKNIAGVPSDPHKYRPVWTSGRGRAFLTAEVWWYQTITNEQGLHADAVAVHLDMNRGHLSDIERSKREAGIITLQVTLWRSSDGGW